MDKEANNATSNEKVIARAKKDGRRFRRVRIQVTGRIYFPATKEESVCTIESISPGDASILCNLKYEPEGQAVLYLDGLGRFEGPVEGPIGRRIAEGFTMTFNCSDKKRERLAEQLMLELNRELISESDLRHHDRVQATSGNYIYFTRSDGEQVRCEVLDMSLTGVSLRTQIKPEVGENLLIGRRAGRVVRHHADGIGIEFFGVANSSAGALDKTARGLGIYSVSSRPHSLDWTTKTEDASKFAPQQNNKNL